MHNIPAEQEVDLVALSCWLSPHVCMQDLLLELTGHWEIRPIYADVPDSSQRAQLIGSAVQLTQTITPRGAVPVNLLAAGACITTCQITRCDFASPSA